GERVRRVPYACDGVRGRAGGVRPCAHVQIHQPGGDAEVRRAEPVHAVPHGQEAGVGAGPDAFVAIHVAVAGAAAAMRRVHLWTWVSPGYRARRGSMLDSLALGGPMQFRGGIAGGMDALYRVGIRDADHAPTHEVSPFAGSDYGRP